MSKRALQRLAKCICFMLCVLFLGQVTVFAATVGSKLATPETGWSRYDPGDQSKIHLTGIWNYKYDTRLWGNSSHATSDKNASCRFKFYGTKLRIIGWYDTNRPTQVNVTIDGNTNSYNPYHSWSNLMLVYEKTGLDLKVHEVIINSPYVGSSCYDVDAIDIDNTGYLVDYNLPMNLTGAAVDSGVVLKWDVVTGATSYNIKTSTTSGGPYTSINTSKEATYLDQAVKANTTYYYVVSANVNGVESPNSNEISVTTQDSPTSPFNLTATVTNSSVSLNWDAVNRATSYIVKRATTAGGPYATVATDLTDTSSTDTDVKKGITYYYIVSAINAGTEIGNSNEASAQPTESQTPPTTDSKLKVVLEVAESLRLSVDDDLNINTQMSWSSSDTAVATVNEKGIVTALAPGNTVITVKSVDGSYTDYINVLVVENADDYRLAIDLKVGETARLTADDFTNTANITWAPMDSSIANVTRKGKVTALSKGLVLISAKDVEGNIIGRVYVRVRE